MSIDCARAFDWPRLASATKSTCDPAQIRYMAEVAFVVNSAPEIACHTTLTEFLMCRSKFKMQLGNGGVHKFI